MRRGMWEAPVALVHHIGFVYASEELGKYPYNSDEVAALSTKAPTADDVTRIKRELSEMSLSFKGKGRVFEGVKLNKKFVVEFVRRRFRGAG
jgi:hypothetical protein